jgi:hypothetical protein
MGYKSQLGGAKICVTARILARAAPCSMIAHLDSALILEPQFGLPCALIKLSCPETAMQHSP